MEARNTELQVGTGYHGRVARENRGDRSGHFYNFAAILRVLPTTHFNKSIRIALFLTVAGVLDGMIRGRCLGRGV